VGYYTAYHLGHHHRTPRSIRSRGSRDQPAIAGSGDGAAGHCMWARPDGLLGRVNRSVCRGASQDERPVGASVPAQSGCLGGRQSGLDVEVIILMLLFLLVSDVRHANLQDRVYSSHYAEKVLPNSNVPTGASIPRS